MKFSSWRLGASHLYGDSNSGLAEGTKQVPSYCSHQYRVGSSASSARFFTGEKLRYDVLRTFVPFHCLLISLIHKTCIIGYNYVLTYDLRFLIISCRFYSIVFYIQRQEDLCIGCGTYQLTFEAIYIYNRRTVWNLTSTLWCLNSALVTKGGE